LTYTEDLVLTGKLRRLFCQKPKIWKSLLSAFCWRLEIQRPWTLAVLPLVHWCYAVFYWCTGALKYSTGALVLVQCTS
jgi:hypothetical protein